MPKQEAKTIELKVVVEKHEDGYVAYPLGLSGVVVGEGDSFEEALADAVSAATAHVETFGLEALEEVAVVDAYVCSEAIRIPCPDSREMQPKPA